MSLVTAILDNQTQTDSTGKHVRNHTHAYSTYTQTQEDNVGGWPRNAAVTEISPHTNKERYDMNLILCEFMKSAHELSYMQNKVIWDGDPSCELGTISNAQILYSTIGLYIKLVSGPVPVVPSLSLCHDSLIMMHH